MTTTDTLPDTIDLTPNWQGLFKYAVAIVRAEVPVGNGQALVVEMLEFGARLEDVHHKTWEVRRKAPSS